MKENQLQYRAESGRAIITGCNYGQETIVIPESIDEYPVSGIAPQAFHHCGAEYIDVPASVTEPGEWFDPEEGIVPLLRGIPIERLMSPSWRRAGALGYLRILKSGETISPDIAGGYESYIRDHFDQFLDSALSDADILERLMESRLIPPEAVEELIRRSHGNPELRALVLAYLGRAFSEDSLRRRREEEERRRLLGPTPRELRALWDTERRSDGTYMLTDWHGKDMRVILPARIGRVPVTAVGRGCFSPSRPGLSAEERNARRAIREIFLADTIRIIEDDAFRGCANLVSVRFPKEPCFIGSTAFADCARFTGKLPAPPLSRKG